MIKKKHLQELEKNGYFVYPNFLTKNQNSKLWRILESLPKKDLHFSYSRTGEKVKKDVSILAPNIMTYSKDFISIATNSKILEVADDYFFRASFNEEKNPYQVHIMHARKVEDECGEQQLHIDSRLRGADPAYMLHVFIYLDDCVKPHSGGIRLVPKSHKLKRYAIPSIDEKKAKEIFAKKGTAIFMNSSLFHAGSEKRTPGTRWVISLVYSRWWVRQPFAIPYFKKWPKKLSEKEKILFGFYNYGDASTKRGISARGKLPKLIPIAND